MPETGGSHEELSAREPRNGEKLPAGTCDAGDQAIGSHFTERQTRHVEAAHERTATTGDPAAVDQPRWACITRKHGHANVILVRLQLRAELCVLFNCLEFALVALEP